MANTLIQRFLPNDILPPSSQQNDRADLPANELVQRHKLTSASSLAGGNSTSIGAGAGTGTGTASSSSLSSSFHSAVSSAGSFGLGSPHYLSLSNGSLAAPATLAPVSLAQPSGACAETVTVSGSPCRRSLSHAASVNNMDEARSGLPYTVSLNNIIIFFCLLFVHQVHSDPRPRIRGVSPPKPDGLASIW